MEEKSAIQLAVSLVLSKLDYCNCLFYSMTNYNFHKLQLVQNHTARVVLKAHKRSSATELLRKLHWLPVKRSLDYTRIRWQICIILSSKLKCSLCPAATSENFITSLNMLTEELSGLRYIKMNSKFENN